MYRLLRPFLFRLDAERAHHTAMGAARIAQSTGSGLVRPWFGFEDPSLKQSVWGLDFQNPVGLAAGFDKNARLVRFWASLGFGFVEAGSISARPAPGNPRPRAFRLPTDRALINRMGLNNDGADVIAARLRKIAGRIRRPLGINLVKTHDPSILGQAGIDDFCYSFRTLAPLADYIALNISCPNTTEGKTFEEPEALDALLRAIFAERNALNLPVPVLIKLSPPSTADDDPHLDERIDLALDHGVAGFVATNTASDRQGLTTAPEVLSRIGRGGLSGPPLAPRATALLRQLYRKTGGTVPLIGVGGIDSPETAYTRIRAGASLVQVYTGLVYEGPGLVKRVKEGLVHLLHRDGFASIREAIGTDA